VNNVRRLDRRHAGMCLLLWLKAPPLHRPILYFGQSFGSASCQTSLARGAACPPTTHSLSCNTYVECSCRRAQIVSVFSSVQALPSLVYQTSFQFMDGLFDQPPRTHI